MRNRRALKRHAFQLTLAVLDRLFDCRRHFVRLAVSPADTSLAIADHHQRVETKPAATFDHCRATPNFYNGFGEAIATPGITRVPVLTSFSRLCHRVRPRTINSAKSL